MTLKSTRRWLFGLAVAAMTLPVPTPAAAQGRGGPNTPTPPNVTPKPANVPPVVHPGRFFGPDSVRTPTFPAMILEEPAPDVIGGPPRSRRKAARRRK